MNINYGSQMDDDFIAAQILQNITAATGKKPPPPAPPKPQALKNVTQATQQAQQQTQVTQQQPQIESTDEQQQLKTPSKKPPPPPPTTASPSQSKREPASAPSTATVNAPSKKPPPPPPSNASNNNNGNNNKPAKPAPPTPSESSNVVKNTTTNSITSSSSSSATSSSSSSATTTASLGAKPKKAPPAKPLTKPSKSKSLFGRKNDSSADSNGDKKEKKPKSSQDGTKKNLKRVNKAEEATIGDIIVTPAGSIGGLYHGGVTEEEAALQLQFKLDRGFIGLFAIEWGEVGPDGKKRDEYLYSLEAPSRIKLEGDITLGEGFTLIEEYGMWRSYFTSKVANNQEDSVFKSNVKKLSDARRSQYLYAISHLESKYSDQPRIVVIRIQEEAEDLYQPPKIGTLIIIWNPIKDSRLLTLQDRSLGVPFVLRSLITWLTKKKIIDSGYFHLKDAADISQNDQQPLQYESMYRYLFKKAIVLDVVKDGHYESRH